MRREIASAHNVRVMLLLAVVLIIILLGIYWLKSVKIGAILGGVAEVLGIFYVLRLDKRQSTRLGYVCPDCGGSLYDGKDMHLARTGQCPRCKKFIIDRLN